MGEDPCHCTNIPCGICCCSTISSDELGIVENFGKFAFLAPPGLLCMPFPCMTKLAGTLSTRQVNLTNQVDAKTKDDVFCSIKLEIQYLLNKHEANNAFYKLTNVEQQIRSYVNDCVRSTMCTRILDEVFNDRDVLISACRARLSEVLGQFGYLLVAVLVNEIVPAAKVFTSMNRIEQYKRLKTATVDQAEAEKNLIIKRAEAEAERKRLQGIGVSRQRKALLRGMEMNVHRFCGLKTGTNGDDINSYVKQQQSKEKARVQSEKQAEQEEAKKDDGQKVGKKVGSDNYTGGENQVGSNNNTVQNTSLPEAHASNLNAANLPGQVRPDTIGQTPEPPTQQQQLEMLQKQLQSAQMKWQQFQQQVVGFQKEGGQLQREVQAMPDQLEGGAINADKQAKIAKYNQIVMNCNGLQQQMMQLQQHSQTIQQQMMVVRQGGSINAATGQPSTLPPSQQQGKPPSAPGGAVVPTVIPGKREPVEKIPSSSSDEAFSIDKPQESYLEGKRPVLNRRASMEFRLAEKHTTALNVLNNPANLLHMPTDVGIADTNLLFPPEALYTGELRNVEGFTASDVMELILITNYFDMLKGIGINDSASTIYIPNSPGIVDSLRKEISTTFAKNNY